MKVSPKYLILLFIVVCIAVIWSVIPYCLDSLSGADATASPHTDDKSSQRLVSADAQKPAYVSDFIYPVDNTRDPFARVSVSTDAPAQAVSPGKKTTIALTGIIWDDEKPIAIVTDSKGNSHLAQIGEEIGKAKILAIQSRSITIQSEGRIQELALWPESVF